MHGSRGMARELLGEILAARPRFQGVEVGVCPPYVLLPAVSELLNGSELRWGAQDVSDHQAGAYTGEVSAGMLAEFGASLVIIGHSERRALFGDTDELCLAKLRQAQTAKLLPVFCVGETQSERRAGATERVVGRQLDALLQQVDAASLLGRLVIAYEPVWAIGTGETASPGEAQAVHRFIRERVVKVSGDAGTALRILYGGSVKPANAADLFAMPDIDGGLIGGAALKGEDFVAICAAARVRLGAA